MAELIPLKAPLDETGLMSRYQPGTTTRAAVATDISRYHHPLFVCSEPGRFPGWMTYFFQAFTGLEEQPQMPLEAIRDTSLTREQSAALSDEYDAARILWSKARLRRQAGPLLKMAAPLWEAWTAAHEQLGATFREFWTTVDGRWRAQLLRLTDAERAAELATEAFDEIAVKLSHLAEEQIRVTGEDEDLPLRTVARELGLDDSDWHIAWHGAYTSSTASWRGIGDRLIDKVHKGIDAQRERLREVQVMAGDKDLSDSELV
ncbi:hypothetical protein [Streptomyces sp. BK340]|uniref:hypothetical protein n=1 Tax=Streptomyces sp. BK340 TaxID=2572903 RepID=UPI0011A65F5D|nr:hypothetical protein [Streptomyces sp. BK340]TVZ90470.1 hypothetical protein FB157_111128 [Streptomyces sp. BK340]